jgi:hypothetical protein
MKPILTLSLLALAFGAAGCGNSTTRMPPKTTNVNTAKTKKTTTASAKKNELSGFGATVAAWNDHHQEDNRFDAGSAYDPDPSLGDGERFNDRYYAVSPLDGRVMVYSMRFPAQTGIEEAKRFVLLSEFPVGAKIVWFKRKDTCAQMLVRSTKVTRVAHSGALIEWSSGEAGDHYDARAVSDAILSPVTGSGKGISC